MQVFTLFSSVFVRIDAEKAVFYNTDKFYGATFIATPEVREISRSLNDIDNLYTIPLTADNLKFCEILCESGFGKIHDETEVLVSFPPSLTLREDWEKIKSNNGQDNAEVLKYLSEIVLFMGGRSDVDNALCYQTDYPIFGNEIIDINLLLNVLEEVSKINRIRLNLVFPFIEGFPGITKVLQCLEQLENEYNIIIRDHEYYGCCDAKNILKDVREKVIVVNDTRHLYSRNISGTEYNRFLIFGRAGAEIAQKLVKEKGLSRQSFIAIYNGKNKGFIREASFPTELELLGGSYTRKHLYAHQVLNTFYFGRLYVLPDGKVFSNLQEKALGTIRDSLYSLICAELDNNYSWRRTRYTKDCCRKCRLADLCPSISPLENSMRAGCILK